MGKPGAHRHGNSETTGPRHLCRKIWEVRVRGSLKSHLWAQFRAAMPNQPPAPVPHTYTHSERELVASLATHSARGKGADAPMRPLGRRPQTLELPERRLRWKRLAGQTRDRAPPRSSPEPHSPLRPDESGVGGSGALVPRGGRPAHSPARPHGWRSPGQWRGGGRLRANSRVNGGGPAPRGPLRAPPTPPPHPRAGPRAARSCAVRGDSSS